jgi:hypothetical protein
MDSSAQLTPLTVDFHEPGFVAAANGENAFRAEKGFWFQLGDDDRQQAKRPWGPANPQALNRYAYVLNNPVRYVDPTGHVGISTGDCLGVTCTTIHLTHDEATALWNFLTENAWDVIGIVLGIGSKTLSGLADGLRNLGLYGAILAEIVQGLALLGLTLAEVLLIISAISYTIYTADYLYGSQGIDIIIDPRIGVPIVAPPTVERQQGVWHFGKKICDSFEQGGCRALIE